MLRLFTTQGFYELWNCRHVVASCVNKRKVLCGLPVIGASPHVLARLFTTGRPVWKDALEPKTDRSEETQSIEIDKWKSIMRSQAASGEKQVSDEEEAGDDGEPVGNLKDGSSLEATRDLVEMWRLAGKFVPQEMTDDEVQALEKLTTKSARKRYLKFLAIKEGFKKSRKEKQQQKKAEREALMEQQRGQDKDAEDGDGQEGQLLKNSLILKYWNRSLDKLLAWNSAQSMLFGQPLVFDMSYESNMSRRELENTVSQLMEVEGCNRRSREPFHLHYCNLQADGAYTKELRKRYGGESWDRLLITATDRHHADVFPHEQLVYLTADSRNVLRKYDHSKVYIIGALVDRSIQSGLSLANAKRLKLATARLPLDDYLQWDIGAKNLTLDQMMRIMLCLSETGKWEEAFKFVPQRKHDGFYKQQTETEMTNNRVRSNRLLKCGEMTVNNKGQSLYRSQKQSGFTDRDRVARMPHNRENRPAETRTSIKSNTEGRKGAGKSKIWWDSE